MRSPVPEHHEQEQRPRRPWRTAGGKLVWSLGILGGCMGGFVPPSDDGELPPSARVRMKGRTR